MKAMRIGRPYRAAALAAVLTLAGVLCAPAARAESFNVTSAPTGAVVEIDGVAVGTTPFRVDYPGGYFHKPHTVFQERLEHKMVLRVSKDGYVLQQITLTDGPFEWIGLTGKHHGKYFVLKADHFELRLEPVAMVRETSTGRVGPIHPRAETGSASGGAPAGVTGTVAIASDPAGAEIYVDGKFVGQTPSTIPLVAGGHDVVVRAAGKKDWERELTVLKESQLTLRAVLEAR